MNRKEVYLDQYTYEHLPQAIALLDSDEWLKLFHPPVYPSEYEEIQELLFAVSTVLTALCGPQPDPITGLVPCGCGGKAILEKGINYHSGYYVICEKCECNIGLDRDDFLRPFGAYPTEEQAMSDWNTAMNYTAPPPSGAIGPEQDGTVPIGDKGATHE